MDGSGLLKPEFGSAKKNRIYPNPEHWFVQLYTFVLWIWISFFYFQVGIYCRIPIRSTSGDFEMTAQQNRIKMSNELENVDPHKEI